MAVTVVIISSFFVDNVDRKRKKASGESFNKPSDLLEEIGNSFHHPLCKMIGAHLIGNRLQILHTYTGTQVTLNLGQIFGSVALVLTPLEK